MRIKSFNNKRLIWVGLVGTVVGAALGLVVAYAAPPPHASASFQKLRRSYPVIGAVGGLICSVGLAMVFSLDAEADQEEESLQDKEDDL